MMKRIAAFIVVLIIALIAFYLYPKKKNSRQILADGVVIDELRVDKSERKMTAYANGELVQTYDIALGKNPIGDKKCEGDKKTPEGRYTINGKNPNSSYHKNLGVSYPDSVDIAHARSIGKLPGGDIKIHGLKNGFGSIGKAHLKTDWTNGCIAVTDKEIDELYRHVRIGAVIYIEP